MVNIREALSSDNAGLLVLTSLTPMRGRISLRIDRNPDFFRLLQKRGHSKVFIAENKGVIVGCFSASAVETTVNGNREKVFYLADLKVHPSYEGSTLTARLLKKMADYIHTIDTDLLFCTAASGNTKVMPLLTGRAGFPVFRYAGSFRVFQLIPLRKDVKSGKFTVTETKINSEIIGLFNQFFSRYRFSPFWSEESLEGAQTIVAIHEQGIRAAISLLDTGSLKQNNLSGLPFLLNLILLLIKAINKIVHLVNLPEPGKPLKMLYIKAFAYRDGYKDALDLLVRHARKLAFLGGYCFLTIGIHEKDSCSAFFKKYPHFTFRSLGFLSGIRGDNEKIDRIIDGVPFEDYSLI
jgi:N-acetylglutamate synthase-like GNAT family acetyltransferase